MCKWNHKVPFTHSRHEWGNLTNFNFACFFINVTIRECNFAMGTILGKGFAQALVHTSQHLCLCKTLSQDCPHGEIRHCCPDFLFLKLGISDLHRDNNVVSRRLGRYSFTKVLSILCIVIVHIFLFSSYDHNYLLHHNVPVMVI